MLLVRVRLSWNQSELYNFSTMIHTCSIDATQENYTMGKLINHTRKGGNVIPKIIAVDGVPQICFMAACEILPGDELLYDYGERNKDIIQCNQWLT